MDCDLRQSVLKSYLQTEQGAQTKALPKGYPVFKWKIRSFGSRFPVKRIRVYRTSSGKISAKSSELLASPQMEELIHLLEPLFDYIIFDAPPVSLVTDAAALGKFADGAILVVRHKVTPVATVKRSVSNLRNAGIPIIGSVLNAYDSKKSIPMVMVTVMATATGTSRKEASMTDLHPHPARD